ncbi:MAG: CCA tRNA nucleotidyltransferase [Acidobacteria bacterium]|nr:CCA tRNA nucleotidyltransferase [Acidobacteriota bacterium]
MSDYMFMLESHLNANQMAALLSVQAAANEANIPVYLTGAALRDMLGGFPIRDLDFTIEGNAIAFAKVLAKKTGARLGETETRRNLAALEFPKHITVNIGMARTEAYGKPASKPQIAPATIHDDLLCRDFTINAIAMSLNKQSLGLLVDPSNGIGDLQNKELRIVGKYTLYDDPSRMLRLFRYRIRMGFALSEKTQNQYGNVRELKLEKKIGGDSLGREFRSIANEANSADIVKLLADEGLLPLFCPALTGAKVNHAGLQKLQKARTNVPIELDFPAANLPLFLAVLCEKLSPRERSVLSKTCGLTKAEVTAWNKLEAAAKKLEKDMKSAALTKPSKIYAAASKGTGEQILFVLYRSEARLVQDRLKNHLQKYMMVAHELTDEYLQAIKSKPGTPKYEKERLELLYKKLDARPKKVVVEIPVPAPALSAPIVASARR